MFIVIILIDIITIKLDLRNKNIYYFTSDYLLRAYFEYSIHFQLLEKLAIINMTWFKYLLNIMI